MTPRGPFLRPAFEARSAVAWALAAAWTGTATALADSAAPGLATCAGLSLAMCAWRSAAAARQVHVRLRLAGTAAVVLPTSRLKAALSRAGDQLWLGWGWRWETRHTQWAHELQACGADAIYPPSWLLRLAGRPTHPARARGLPWIHGIEAKEGEVVLPFDDLRGHCAVVATTGALKTRLAGLVIFQLALRGDCIIVIDPKGDRDLRDICRQAAALAGDPGRFLMLHPAFAAESVRLDLLKNWDRVSQVASRIHLVLDAQPGDTFAEFCWMAVHRITNALKFMGRRATLQGLKSALESRVALEQLALQALECFFADDGHHLHEALEAQRNVLRAQPGGARTARESTRAASIELTARIKVFRDWQPDTTSAAVRGVRPHKPEEITGLLALLDTDAEWFGKMVAGILPILTKLTTDDLLGLLSPDYDDLEDTRPILDIGRVVAGRHILYIGTDTLADESVGRAISTLALADASAVAAEIYNHGTPSDAGAQARRVHVVIDEWGDAMCAPVIQQANKGRGAGFFIWALGQTYPDLVDRFGNNDARARRFLGNMNNLIVGATHDADTMDLLAAKLGETRVGVRSESRGFSARSSDLGLGLAASSSTSVSSQTCEVFPRQLLAALPDLHYVALLNRGELIKGRIPVLVPDTAA